MTQLQSSILPHITRQEHAVATGISTIQLSELVIACPHFLHGPLDNEKALPAELISYDIIDIIVK